MKLKEHAFRGLALGFFVYWGMTSIDMDLSLNHVFAQDDVTQEVLEHLTHLGEETGSYRADVTSIVKGRKGSTYHTKGKFKFKWPRMLWQKNWRVEDNTLLGISSNNKNFKWLYIPRLNAVLKYDRKALNEDAQQKGWLSAAALDGASLQYVGKESMRGEEVYVIQAEPNALLKHENPDPPGNTQFYIGAKDGIMRKIVTYDSQDRETGSQIFSNIRIDPSISDKDFEFVPPEGTQIHEVKEIDKRIKIPFRARGK